MESRSSTPKVQTSLSLNTESHFVIPDLSPMCDSPKPFRFESDDIGSSISLDDVTSPLNLFHLFPVSTPTSNQPAMSRSTSLTENDSSAVTSLFGNVADPFYTLPELSKDGEVIETKHENDETNSQHSLHTASTISLESELEQKSAPEKKKRHKRKSTSPAESDLSENHNSSESGNSSQSKKDRNNESARQSRKRKKQETTLLKEKVENLQAQVSHLNSVVKKLEKKLATARAGTSGYTNYQPGIVSQKSGLRLLGASIDAVVLADQATPHSKPHNNRN